MPRAVLRHRMSFPREGQELLSGHCPRPQPWAATQWQEEVVRPRYGLKAALAQGTIQDKALGKSLAGESALEQVVSLSTLKEIILSLASGKHGGTEVKPKVLHRNSTKMSIRELLHLEKSHFTYWSSPKF